jgi:hypothetical protein
VNIVGVTGINWRANYAVATAHGSDKHYKNLVRFSRNQLIGALILLVIVWMVILFRMLS